MLGLLKKKGHDPDLHVYVDGGVVSNNPSAIGGTWAFVVVRSDVCLEVASGYVRPADLGVRVVTNNQTELLAAVTAMECLSEEFDGTLHTDSQVTIHRLNRGALNGVPQCLRDRLSIQLARMTLLTFEHVAGHPTEEELAAGHRGGTPVSKWNRMCDEMCGRAAKTMLAGA